MALVHDLEKSGNWLFKRRGWLPLFLILPTLIVLWLTQPPLEPDYLTDLIFVGVSLAGQLIRILTVGFVPRGTSGRNVNGQVAEQINTTGIYSLVRHPLYIGNFLMWLGPVLFVKSIWWTLIFTLIYWIYYERIIFAEEQFLRKKFGKDYDLWSEKVGILIPRFRNWTPSNLTFSLRNVLKREYNSITSMIIIFVFLDICRNFIPEHQLLISPPWMYAGIIIIIFWLIIRALRKSTKVLNVKGR